MRSRRATFFVMLGTCGVFLAIGAGFASRYVDRALALLPDPVSRFVPAAYSVASALFLAVFQLMVVVIVLERRLREVERQLEQRETLEQAKSARPQPVTAQG